MINHINEIIVGEQGANQSLLNNPKSKTPEPEGENSPTWINEIFQVNFDDYIPLAPSYKGREAFKKKKQEIS